MENFNELSCVKQNLIIQQLRVLNNEEILTLVNDFESYEKFNILNLENLWSELHNDYDQKQLIELFLRSEINSNHEFYYWKINNKDKEFIISYSREELINEYLYSHPGFLPLLDKVTNGKIEEIIEAEDKSGFAFA